MRSQTSWWVQKLQDSVQDLVGKAGEKHGQTVQKESEQYCTLSAELVTGWLSQ